MAISSAILALLALSVPLGQGDWLRYRVVDLGVLGSDPESAGAALVDRTLAAGTSFTAGSSRPFLWDARRGRIDAGFFAGARTVTTQAMNRFGHLVGLSDGNRGIRAWLWREGQGYTDLAAVGNLGISGAFGIDDAGNVVGYGRAGFPFLWSEGEGTTWLPGLPGTSGEGAALSIDEAGRIAGFLFDARGRSRPVLWEGRQPRDLGVPEGYFGGQAVAMSRAGLVLANLFDDSQAPFAAMTDGSGRWTLLGVLPGGNFLRGADVNAAGWAVGEGSSSFGGRAWLWRPGAGLRMLDELLEPGSRSWTVERAAGIDDDGVIVATGTRDGQTRALLLWPTPRPSVFAEHAGG